MQKFHKNIFLITPKFDATLKKTLTFNNIYLKINVCEICVSGFVRVNS